MRLPVQTYQLRQKNAASSRLINCYVESLPADARAPYLLRRSPGVLLGPGAITGHAIKLGPNSRPSAITAVFDNAIKTVVIGDGTVTGSTPIASITSRVDIAKGNAGTVVVVEPNAYSATTGSWSVINDADFTSRGAKDVEFLDQFMLFTEPGSARFFGSDVGSVTAFTSTNFATAEANPDSLVGIKSNQSQIVLFGENSVEIWDTTGGSGFPFRPVINGSIGVGCIASESINEIDNKVFWVADDKTVRTLAGQSAAKISTPGIDQMLEDEGGITDIRSDVYSLDGHNYYSIHLTDCTLVYDIESGLWHERLSAGYARWKWRCATTLKGVTYVGSERGGRLGELSPETFTEIDDSTGSASAVTAENVPMQWTYMPVFSSGQRVFHDRLEIILNTGSGLVGGNEPMISLEISEDGGETWEHVANRSLGAYGRRFQRVQWHGLGASYQRVYRATVTEPVPVTVTDTLLHAKGGSV